jgi:hypothetical protein
VPCTFGTAPRNGFIGSRVCLRPFATIRPSTRSLSKKTKESYTLGNPDAIECLSLLLDHSQECQDLEMALWGKGGTQETGLRNSVWRYFR